MSQSAFFASVLGLILLTTVVDGCGPSFGLEVRPNGPNFKPPEIRYHPQYYETFRKYTDEITEFLKVYMNPRTVPGGSQNIVNCDLVKPAEHQVCDINVRNLGPCVAENQYGYAQGSPCVFLRANNTNKWLPEFYPNKLPDILPAEMPRHLKVYIGHDVKPNTVWVSCDGINPADKENIGHMNFYPQPGYSANYFLHSDKPGYLSPIIAVHFERPKRGINLNVLCKAWASNIKHVPAAPNGFNGTVAFQFSIDP